MTYAPFDKNGVFLRVSEGQQSLARQIAKIRSQGHNHCRKRSEDLGSAEKNLMADYWGVLAEIVLNEAQARRGAQLCDAYVEDQTPQGADWITDRHTYDVKACPPGKNYLCINAAAHHDPSKRPDFYLPVLFVTPTCVLLGAPIPAGEVDHWRLMTNGHSPYYSTHRNTVKPLSSLDALPSPGEQERDPFTE